MSQPSTGHFKGYRIHQQDGQIVGRFDDLSLDDLTAGEVVIRARYSSINYKDALAATGAGKIMRRFPLVGGIDVAGHVESSADDRYAPGDPVLVTGCGPIGVLAIMCARRAGADLIVATDLSDFTLGKAREAGADHVINVASNPAGLDPFKADKGQIDTLFECTGAQIALASAIPCLRPRGVIVQLGLGGDMTLPMQMITAKELQLRGSFRFHHEFHTGVSLMQKGLINVKPLITHSLPMDDAVKAFELASDRSQTMKAQLDFTTR